MSINRELTRLPSVTERLNSQIEISGREIREAENDIIQYRAMIKTAQALIKEHLDNIKECQDAITKLSKTK